MVRKLKIPYMLWDFIQLANNQNLESAFIFLDQEKAFERVNQAFGIGPAFSHWICQIYSNVTMRVKVNEFLSENIQRRKAGVPFKSSSLRPHY